MWTSSALSFFAVLWEVLGCFPCLRLTGILVARVYAEPDTIITWLLLLSPCNTIITKI